MTIGTGSYMPDKVWTNKDLEEFVDTNDEWIYNTLGISERRIASHEEHSSDLGAEAARRAIDNAGLKAEDIDIIIVATATPDRKIPSTACIIQDKIEAYGAAAFDISAVCSGFLYGIVIAAHMPGNILVIGVDTFSKITDWTKRDCVFFGDGAGAAVVNKGEMFSRLCADGRGWGSFTVESKYYEMNGRDVYNTAISVLPIAINGVLKDAGMTIDDIDYMIPHQPGIGILKETARRIKMPFEKVLTNMDKYANTAGASIPILLDEANREGKLEGKTILLAAVGAGWTWGAAIIKW